MSRRAFGFLAFLLAVLLVPRLSLAQYMYLDSNGDGIHDAADTLASNGTTHVDVWLVTNGRADGSPATCGTGPEELTINSYEFLLHAFFGTVVWSGYQNHFPVDPAYAVTDGSTGDFYGGYGGSQILPAGKYLLASMSITATSGAPAVRFLGFSPTHGQWETAFGSACFGIDGDNTLKLGGDWPGAAGIGPDGYRPGAPVLTPVPDVSLEFGTVDSLDVTAVDWDEDPISVRLIEAPDFATLEPWSTENGLVRARLRIRGTRAGTYPVVIGASDGASETADTVLVTIVDNGVNHAPRFEPLANLTVNQGQSVTENLVASDADGGDLRIELVQAPRYVGLGAPRNTPGRVERSLRAAPGGMDGSGTVRLRCTDGLIETLDSLQVLVNDVEFAPRFLGSTAPFHCAAQTEGGWIAFPFADADGDSMNVSTQGLPSWARLVLFNDQGMSLGMVNLVLEPQATDPLGSYPVRVRIQDPAGTYAEASTTIDLGPPGSCGEVGPPVCGICATSPVPPEADIGGPYRGVAGVPISFDGTRSHDVQGSVLQFRWDFGDGTNKVSGAHPSHTYARGGEFQVLLSVSNLGGTSRDSARVEVAEGYPVRAFTHPANRPVVAAASNERFEIFMEAADSLYSAGEIDPASVVVTRAGVPGEAHALLDKGSRLGDSDRNGIADLAVDLDGAALRSLVSSETGRMESELKVGGRLQGGAHITGPIRLNILGMPTRSHRAVASPNPMNPAGVLAFELREKGHVGVRLYDTSGRLVRTLLDAELAAGPVTIPFDGRDARGRELATGIYFYRIESSDGRQVGRISILK